MRQIAKIAAVMWLLALAAVAHGEVLDRIIAVVNNTPIMLSDWDEEWRCEALLAGRTPESYSEAEQHEVFDRMVDQELLRQQMRTYLLQPVSDADVQLSVQETKKQLAKGDDAAWQLQLKRAGVTEREITAHSRRQLEIERFVDTRFRAGIRIEDRTVRRYYRNEFLPQLHSSGAEDVPFDTVSGKIREILIQQRINEQLSGWLQTLREQAEIRIEPQMAPDSKELDVTLAK